MTTQKINLDTCENCKLSRGGQISCICVKCPVCGAEKDMIKLNCVKCILERKPPFKDNPEDPYNEIHKESDKRQRFRAVCASLAFESTI